MLKQLYLTIAGCDFALTSLAFLVPLMLKVTGPLSVMGEGRPGHWGEVTAGPTGLVVSGNRALDLRQRSCYSHQMPSAC